ncbi:MAG: GntR family transcriptional regulator [Aestuariivita sp.]|nr:GntR family transcriptional regulator [Aestuariivita sp.]
MIKKNKQKGALGPPDRRKKRGALFVHEHLRDEIMWMAIEPGSALDEVALASRYGVSRTPVREALLLLENEGFVQFLPNRTTIVAPLSLANVPEFLDTYLLLARGLVRSAAMNKTASFDCLLLYRELFETHLTADNQRQAFQAQLDLYRALSAAANNRFLCKYFIEVQDASIRLKQLHYYPHLDQAGKAEAVDLLESIAKSVASGDPEMSDKAIVSATLFEAEIIQKSLGPKYGHLMKIGMRSEH